MKKILIFSSYGGGGHISATDTLKEYLQHDYDMNTVYLIDEVLGCLDPIKIVSFKKYTEEKFYNYCLQKKWTWFINKMYQLAVVLIYLNEKVIRRIITSYLKQRNPDLVISVIPMFNNVLKDSCKECNIPFLLVPTDLDVTSFISNITPPSNDKFLIALPFEDAEILNFAQNSAISDDSRLITGFPIKSSFFEPKDHEQIKKNFDIPLNKYVILVLMGAAGSKAMYYYLLTLLQLKTPVHLILCLGRNESLRNHIERIKKPDHITVTILSYTNKIADLMAISDLCITKAGTVSVCETVYMNLPIILDNTSTPLFWEKFNIDFIQKHKFGTVLTHYKQLNNLVNKMITDSSYYATCKKNLAHFPKKNFGDCIKDVVSQLLPR
jgi:processive 1,2-diacylglycerol beta-glucosyltransferase